MRVDEFAGCPGLRIAADRVFRVGADPFRIVSQPSHAPQTGTLVSTFVRLRRSGEGVAGRVAGKVGEQLFFVQTDRGIQLACVVLAAAVRGSKVCAL